MKIDVTDLDILKGLCYHRTLCPVALAVKRVVGTKNVAVGHAFIKINDKPVDLPSNVRVFIAKFDQQEEVDPFSFNLDLP